MPFQEKDLNSRTEQGARADRAMSPLGLGCVKNAATREDDRISSEPQLGGVRDLKPERPKRGRAREGGAFFVPIASRCGRAGKRRSFDEFTKPHCSPHTLMATREVQCSLQLLHQWVRNAAQ